MWFYDEQGSKLFEAITATPEYYPTETERSILAENADRILDAVNAPRVRVAELGAGSASKTITLLAAVAKRQAKVRFAPIDVSEEALRLARENMAAALPDVEVQGIVARNRVGIRKLDWAQPDAWLVLYLGSSIGNLHPDEAIAWLRDVGAPLREDDALLLGVDRHKDARVLHAAYNDAQGVTAEFNLNLLDRMNRELGARFDRRDFEHVAFYNEAEHRVEMHLRARRRHDVEVPGVGVVRFDEGETIHTECSYKYTEEMLRALVRGAGLRERARFADPRGWFNVLLLERDA